MQAIGRDAEIIGEIAHCVNAPCLARKIAGEQLQLACLAAKHENPIIVSAKLRRIVAA